jgi:acyl carrier protein
MLIIMTEVNHAEVMNELQNVFRTVFNNPSLVLTDETTADGVPGWDSLQQIKIILGCEKKFGVKLRARDVNGLGNAGHLVDHLVAVINKSRK